MIDAALLIELALKSVLVAGGTLALLRLARHRSAAERSWIGHLGLVALVVLPAASLLMPGWNPIPATATVETAATLQIPAAALEADATATSATLAPDAAVASAPAAWALPSAGEIAVWVYAVPLALLLLAMLIAVIRLGAMHRRANVLVESSWLNALAQAQRRMGFKHGTALLVSDELRSPVSWGLMRPIIRVLDADLARAPANGAWVALCLVALTAVAAPLAAFDPTVTRPRAALAAVEAATPLAVADPRAVIAPTPAAIASPVGQAAPAASVDPKAKHSKDEQDDEIDTIIASRAVGLTPEYINSMRAAGFAGSMDDLTGARAVGVTPEFARQMRRYDSTVDLETVIAARATGLSGTYFAEMRRMFPGLTLDDAVGMSSVGVSLDYAREMRALFPRVSADDVQSMRAVGVTPAYVHEMRRQGLSAGDPEEAIEGRLFSSGMKGPLPGPIPDPAALASAIIGNVADAVAAVPPAAPPAPPGNFAD